MLTPWRLRLEQCEERMDFAPLKYPGSWQGFMAGVEVVAGREKASKGANQETFSMLCERDGPHRQSCSCLPASPHTTALTSSLGPATAAVLQPS